MGHDRRRARRSPDAIRGLIDACEVAIENRFEIPITLLVKPMAEVIDLSNYRNMEVEDDDRAQPDAEDNEYEEMSPDQERARHEAAEAEE